MAMAPNELSASKKLDFIREVQIRSSLMVWWMFSSRSVSDLARAVFKDLYPEIYHCNWSRNLIRDAVEQSLPVEPFETTDLSKLNYDFGMSRESHYLSLESIANGI